MTPNQNKPPVLLSHQFQSALLIAIFTVGVTILIKMFSFTADFVRMNENHERRISNLESQSSKFDLWKESFSENSYYRQGRRQLP